MDAFQSIRQTDCHQFVPVTLIYQPNENQTPQPLPAASAPLQESTAAGSTSVDVVAPPFTIVHPPPSHLSNHNPSFAANHQSCLAGSQGAGRDVTAAEEWEEERLEQFQDNIPGFISYFLNPENTDGTRRRRRAGTRQRAGVRGGRRSGTEEQRDRKPRGRTGGRGRGGFTQKVDVQEVGVSKLQKLFLHRWEMRTPRTGQGGGAVGRKLFLKSREVLKPTRTYQRRRGRGKEWEVSQSGDLLLCTGGRGGNAQCERKNTLHLSQDSLPVSRTQKGSDNSAPVPFSGPLRQFHNIHIFSSSSPTLQPSPSHSLLSPAASHLPPALLHTNPLPPAAPPPQEDHPERIDRLLEEVMMGLDILTNSDGATHLQCSPPTGGSTVVLNKQQEHSAVTEAPVLQQPREGELNEMLDHFLQSFEQHVEDCSAREENEMGGESSSKVSQAYTVTNRSKRTKTKSRAPHTTDLQSKHTPHRAGLSQTSEQHRGGSGLPQSQSQSHKAPAQRATSSEETEYTQEKARRSNKRRPRAYPFSLEKKRAKRRKRSSSNNRRVPDQRSKQLLTPLVNLDRKSMLSATVTLQEHSCQSLQDQSPAKATTGLPSGISSNGGISGKKQEAFVSTKTYPIRSRFKGEFIMESLPILPHKRPPDPYVPTGRKRGRPRKIRGPERGAESHEQPSVDATVTKRICLAQTAEPSRETSAPAPESAELVPAPATVELEEVVDVQIDIETVSPTSLREYTRGAEQKGEAALSEIILKGSLTDDETESGADDIIDVEDHEGPEAQTLSHLNDWKCSVSPAEQLSLECTGKWEEDKDDDVDVIGASSPVPDPVIISWTEFSGGEEEEGDEDIDVVGEKADCASSAIFYTLSQGELVSRKCQTELLSH
ncbi:uncharacterized protein LOC142397157 [Odontesthes bonariensis]|uniref:uncharacterized protein LOC142397157 n=1 Tax=Odontesthes bonariensis TaxID=219752 RepID=UPI003F583E9F